MQIKFNRAAFLFCSLALAGFACGGSEKDDPEPEDDAGIVVVTDGGHGITDAGPVDIDAGPVISDGGSGQCTQADQYCNTDDRNGMRCKNGDWVVWTCGEGKTCSRADDGWLSCVPVGGEDGGIDDAGIHEDAGYDAGLHDAGIEDAGIPDGGIHDAGIEDAGIEDAGPDECPPNHFGADCQPCNCDHGICDEGKSGGGECLSCTGNYWGKNCDNNTINCTHGTPSIGIEGNGQCASCDEHWDLAKNCSACKPGWDIAHNCSQLAAGFGTVTDAAGNSYLTTTVDGMTWMAENLRYQANGITCHANTWEDPNFIAKYGCLYEWETVMQLSVSCETEDCTDQIQTNHQGICPQGWHVPTKTEMEKLLIAAGLTDRTDEYDATVSINLRATSWDNGASLYGFEALPAGERDKTWSGCTGRQCFYGFGEEANFWTADQGVDPEYHKRVATELDIVGHNNYVDANNEGYISWPSGAPLTSDYAFSLRCVKNADAAKK